MAYKVVLLFGPPGVGKGTQGKMLGTLPGICHLATGEMFRALSPESELGKRVHAFSSRGELVPDNLTIELWQTHVKGMIERGDFDPAKQILLLDGIPRTADQAAAMRGLIEVLGILHLTVPDIETMITRMKKRAFREGRTDDADESIIRRRFEVYEEETAPVLSQYSDGFAADVNALGTPLVVLHRVLEALIPMTRSLPNPLD